MCFVADLNELCGNAHTIPCPTHAPSQDVRNAELPADLAHAFLGRAVLHGRCASDHSEPFGTDPSELCNHFLSNALAEVVVFLVAAKIFKWQHDQHDSFCLCCCRRGPGGSRSHCCEN